MVGVSCLREGCPGLGTLSLQTSHPCSRWPGRTARFLWARGMRACGPVINATGHALAVLRAVPAAGGSPEGGGGSCLCEGCPASGTLPSPTARPAGLRPGSATNWLPMQCAGVGTCTPQCARGLAGATVRGRFGVPWHIHLCRGSMRVLRSSRICNPRCLLLLGTCPCALVAAGGVPRLVLSLPSALLGRCAGHVEASEYQALAACRWLQPRQGRWARSSSYLFGAPRWGCPLRSVRRQF